MNFRLPPGSEAALRAVANESNRNAGYYSTTRRH
jgi:hypothetical protein